MKHLLTSLVILGLCLAACRSGEPRAVYRGEGPRLERLGMKTAALRTDMTEALELLPRAGARLGYGLHEIQRGASRLLLRTEVERAFFSMLGEQERFHEVDVHLRAEGGRVVIEVDEALVHGPAGGPHRRKGRAESEWYDDFFEAVSVEVGHLSLRGAYAIPRE
ncbi:MAG: hypothetical protein ACI8Y8_000559 [Planctomycetota bacterium]